MIEENPDIRDKYMLCYTYGMEAHMTKVSYDDINCALQEGERRFRSNHGYRVLYLYDIWNQKTIKRWI